MIAGDPDPVTAALQLRKRCAIFIRKPRRPAAIVKAVAERNNGARRSSAISARQAGPASLPCRTAAAACRAWRNSSLFRNAGRRPRVAFLPASTARRRSRLPASHRKCRGSARVPARPSVSNPSTVRRYLIPSRLLQARLPLPPAWHRPPRHRPSRVRFRA